MKSDNVGAGAPPYPENLSRLLTYLERLAEPTPRSAERECKEERENAANTIESRLTLMRREAAPQVSQSYRSSPDVLQTLAILEKMSENKP